MNAHPLLAQPIPTAWKLGVVATTTLAGAFSLWVLWTHLTRFDDPEALIAGGIMVLIPSAAWLTLAVLGGLNYRTWWRLGLLMPAIVAITTALSLLQVPGQIGWAMSRGAMNRAAATCDAPEYSAGRDFTYKREKIGMYDFHHIERESHGGCEFVLMGYPTSRTGFLFLPHDERRDGAYGHRYQYLGDHWYYYEL
ncbi:hypothetical protein AB0H76_13035 [Nocardia sp. NPDC050712]|uniref:hypothetical protein n=1 Tax=Nocardia sp. NPDC050712 TaxID=3155518 RepID=UPI0033DE3836